MWTSQISVAVSIIRPFSMLYRKKWESCRMPLRTTNSVSMRRVQLTVATVVFWEIVFKQYMITWKRVFTNWFFLMPAILFVCLGNICRSPLAEGVMRNYLKMTSQPNNVTVDSAATSNYHTGESPHSGGQRCAKETWFWHFEASSPSSYKEGLWSVWFDYWNGSV